MTEGDRALVHLAHTHGIAHVARTLGTTNHLAKKRVDQARRRVTNAMWRTGKDTPEGAYYEVIGNGMKACSTAKLRMTSEPPATLRTTTDKAS